MERRRRRRGDLACELYTTYYSMKICLDAGAIGMATRATTTAAISAASKAGVVWHVQVRREPTDQPHSRQEGTCNKEGVRFYDVLGSSQSSQLTSRRAAHGHVKWPGARRETERDMGALTRKVQGTCDRWGLGTANVLPVLAPVGVATLMVMPEMQPQRSDVRLGCKSSKTTDPCRTCGGSYF